MARVVIVRVSVDEHPAFHRLIAKIDPTGQFSRAIDDRFVPSCGLRFDAFAVAQPSDVGPVGCDWVELQIRWARHPRAILKDESDTVITQETRQFCIEPGPIANLDCKFVSARKLSKEWDKPIQKLVAHSPSTVMALCSRLALRQSAIGPCRRRAARGTQSLGKVYGDVVGSARAASLLLQMRVTVRNFGRITDPYSVGAARRSKAR